MDMPLKLLTIAAILLGAHASPVIRDADYTDDDLLAEESHVNLEFGPAPGGYGSYGGSNFGNPHRHGRGGFGSGFHNPGFHNPGFHNPGFHNPGFHNPPPVFGHGRGHSHFHGYGPPAPPPPPPFAGPPGFNKNRRPFGNNPPPPPPPSVLPSRSPSVAPIPQTPPPPPPVVVKPTQPTIVTTAAPPTEEPSLDIDLRFSNN